MADVDTVIDELSADLLPKISKKGKGKQPIKAKRDNTMEPAEATDSEDLNSLKATVLSLSNTMKVFMERIMEGDSETEPVPSMSNDTTTPATCTSGDDIIAEMAQYYDASETVSPKIDEKLSELVNNVAKVKLSEERVKDKMSIYTRPENCNTLVPTKVNPEIWDKLSYTTRSRDVKMQRVQMSLVKGMLPIVSSADIFVRKTREGATLSVEDINVLTKNSVDALALLCHANQELNNRRKEFMRNDLNHEYKDLCNSQSVSVGMLFGDDLPEKIKQINETNKIVNKLSAKSHNASSRYQPYRKDYPISQRRGGSYWRQSFRQAFLGNSRATVQSGQPQQQWTPYRQGKNLRGRGGHHKKA